MARRPINQTLLHLVGPLVVGVAFLAIALIAAAHTSWVLLSGTSTEGHISSLIKQTRTESSKNDDVTETYTVFVPVFAFKASDGRDFTVRSNSGSNPPGYAVGDRVKVIYMQDHPVDARISTFGQLWGTSCAFGIAGAVLCLVGWLLLTWGRFRIRAGLPTTTDKLSQRLAAAGKTIWF